MGCLQSKKESTDLHPNIFRVINIAENGSDLCSGQLEVTESDIILYREGRDSTVWPLHSLRRYGFEGEIFSFESGRRCETGEGIYAFRCRRASLLFRTLQQRIQIRNVVHESAPYPASRLTTSPQGRQTLQATVIHRSSVDIGHLDIMRPNNSNLPGIFRNEANAPQSPSSVDILEVMPLYPREHSTSSQVTNIYLLKDFKREHNNNDSGSIDPQHVYCNDFTRDLAKLRNTLRQEQVLNTMRDIEDENIFLESRYMNEFIVDKQNNNPLSPTLSNASEHYAQLSSEQQEAARFYMNVPNEAKVEVNKFNAVPSKPLTPKPVAYCNLAIGTKSELNSYANLSLGDLGDSSKTLRYALSSIGPFEHRRKFSQSDTFPSMSLGDDTELSYAILDIKTNEGLEIVREMMESEVYAPSQNEAARAAVEASGQPRPRLKSQCSMEQAGPAAGGTAAVSPPALGYTIIDFDKTVALTSVAAGGEVEAEGPRKTRHNSCNIGCGSPVVADKNNKQNN